MNYLTQFKRKYAEKEAAISSALFLNIDLNGHKNNKDAINL
jgi:hypothetical protein